MNIRLLVIYFLLLTCQSTKSNMRSKCLLQKLPSLLKEWSMFFANNEHLYNQRRKLGKTCSKLALFNIKMPLVNVVDKERYKLWQPWPFHILKSTQNVYVELNCV